jgi:O-antigen/teichoic acid export membrane protein
VSTETDESPEPETPRGARRLVTTFVSLMGAELLTRGLLLGTGLILVRALSPGSFGEFTYAVGVATIAGFIIDLGLTALITRDISAKPEAAGELLGSFLATQAILAGFIMLLSLVLAGTGTLLGPASGLAIVIAFAATSANSLNRPFEATLTGRAKSHLVTVSRGFRGVTLLAGTAVAAIVRPAPETFLLAVVASEVVGVIAVGRLCVTRSTRPARVWDRGQLRRLFRLALPFAVVTGLNILFVRIDIVMLGQLDTEEAVGNYGAALRVLETAIVVPAYFGSAFLATIAQTGPRTPEARTQTLAALRLIVLLCMPLTVGLAVAATPVMSLITGPGYGSADDALRLLSPVLLLIATYGVLLSLQTALDNIGLLVKINLMGLVLKVALNAFAIPAYGLRGAAVAAVAAEFAVVVAQWASARRHFELRRAATAMLRAGAAGAAMLAASVALLAVVPPLAAAALGAVVYAGAVILTRSVAPAEVRAAWTSVRLRTG